MPIISKHGKLNEFFMYMKDESSWTSILKKHEEALLESNNNMDNDAELELDFFFVSYYYYHHHIHKSNTLCDRLVM
jgi:hypothetical protein